MAQLRLKSPVSEDEIFGTEELGTGLRMGDTYVRLRAGDVVWKPCGGKDFKVVKTLAVTAGEEFTVAMIYREDEQVMLRSVADRRRLLMVAIKTLKREWKRVGRAPAPPPTSLLVREGLRL